MTLIIVSALVAFLMMGVEAAIAARHDRGLRALGAVEPADDVYPAMRIVYPAAFLAMVGEGAWRGVDADPVFTTGVVVFALAKVLKYWAIATLGPRWTFRVLVPPGSERTRRGPYRWLSHPNYVGVALELVGLAIAMHARIAGPIGVAAFGYLMWRRVQVEEKALAGQ